MLEPWIPVTRADGTVEWIAPWQLTDELSGNPITALAYSRADLTGSIVQFLIGLLQTTAPNCEDQVDWDDLYQTPPDSSALRGWLEPWTSAFELNGTGGPRFMQDTAPEVQEAALQNISSLLIDAPGGNTLRHNIDHFVKRGGVNRLSPPLAAAALYTLQTNAPSGGQGHRTSLRGGGPLTTLVVRDPRQAGNTRSPSPLWHNLWLNVLDWERFTRHYPCPRPTAPSADVFPWLAATRTSNPKAGGVNTTPVDVHPVQAYWAMPRRLLLDFDNTEPGECDLSDVEDAQCLTRYRAVNFGVNDMKARGNIHYRRVPHRREDEPPSSLKPKQFRDYAGLLYGERQPGIHCFRTCNSRPG